MGTYLDTGLENELINPFCNGISCHTQKIYSHLKSLILIIHQSHQSKTKLLRDFHLIISNIHTHTHTHKQKHAGKPIICKIGQATGNFRLEDVGNILYKTNLIWTDPLYIQQISIFVGSSC